MTMPFASVARMAETMALRIVSVKRRRSSTRARVASSSRVRAPTASSTPRAVSCSGASRSEVTSLCTLT